MAGNIVRSDKWRGNVVVPLYATRSAYSSSIRPTSKAVVMTPEQHERQRMQRAWLEEAIAAQERKLDAVLDLKSLEL